MFSTAKTGYRASRRSAPPRTKRHTRVTQTRDFQFRLPPYASRDRSIYLISRAAECFLPLASYDSLELGCAPGYVFRMLPRTSLTTRTRCRVCDSPELTPILSLGAQCIAGAFADPGSGQPVARRVPLGLVRCEMTRDLAGCGLIQLRHAVPGTRRVERHQWWIAAVHPPRRALRGAGRGPRRAAAAADLESSHPDLSPENVPVAHRGT
jgi:hypothetical protein